MEKRFDVLDSLTASFMDRYGDVLWIGVRDGDREVVMRRLTRYFGYLLLMPAEDGLVERVVSRGGKVDSAAADAVGWWWEVERENPAIS